MKLKVIALATALAASTADDAQANHYLQTADPTVVNALNELVYFYGSYCQAGIAQGCHLMNAVQQHGGVMLNAGYDCQTGNQQACAIYQRTLGEFQTFYYQASQSAAQANVGYHQNYSQQAHMQRMQEIHDFGVANQQAFQNRMDMMDSNHQQFLEMLRQ